MEYLNPNTLIIIRTIVLMGLSIQTGVRDGVHCWLISSRVMDWWQPSNGVCRVCPAKILAVQNVRREIFSSTNVRREKLFSVANTTSSSNQNHNKDGRLWAPFLQWLTYHCHCIFLMYPFEGLCVFQCCIVNLLEACRSLHWHDWKKAIDVKKFVVPKEKKLRTLFDDNFVALPPLQKVPTVTPT